LPISIKEDNDTRKQTFIFSEFWYYIVVFLAVSTTISVFIFPDGNLIRGVLGLLFIWFLPGFVLFKAIFPNNVPLKTSSMYFDAIEILMISIGVSLAIVPLLDLTLYYLQIGIDKTPITIFITVFVIVMSTIAVLRGKNDALSKVYK
jgi:uncharacterized membrane protein